MVEQKSVGWKQEYAREAAIRRHPDRYCPVRKDLATRISYHALDLLRTQVTMASSARLGTHDLGQCTGAFTAQYGLPCKHMIYGLLQVQTRATGAREIVAIQTLELREVCKHWRLPMWIPY